MGYMGHFIVTIVIIIITIILTTIIIINSYCYYNIVIIGFATLPFILLQAPRDDEPPRFMSHHVSPASRQEYLSLLHCFGHAHVEGGLVQLSSLQFSSQAFGLHSHPAAERPVPNVRLSSEASGSYSGSRPGEPDQLLQVLVPSSRK